MRKNSMDIFVANPHPHTQHLSSVRENGYYLWFTVELHEFSSVAINKHESSDRSVEMKGKKDKKNTRKKVLSMECNRANTKLIPLNEQSFLQ